MDRYWIERVTDTTAFRVALALSGALVLPVLALGILVTVIGGTVLLVEQAAIELVQLAVGALSLGGVVGLVGYMRALAGARKPERHNVTATVLCLAAGVVTALIVAGYSVVGTLDGLRFRSVVSLAALFAAANVVWAVAGLAWIRRLPRRYAERTGRAFDGLPALLLFMALALAAAATLLTTAL